MSNLESKIASILHEECNEFLLANEEDGMCNFAFEIIGDNCFYSVQGSMSCRTLNYEPKTYDLPSLWQTEGKVSRITVLECKEDSEEEVPCDIKTI